MKRTIFLAAVLALTIGACGNPASEGEADGIKMQPRVGPLGSLIVVSLTDFPATFAFRSGSKSCTSVLVGARALLTAAHCVGSSGKGQIELEGTREWRCTRAPGFREDLSDRRARSADWALCRPEQDGPEIRLTFERLNDRADALQTNDQLLLTGFGGVDQITVPDGQFRAGRSTIVSLPRDDNFIKTRGGAELFFGDSGGPAFLLLAEQPNGQRRVVGVNAIGGPEPGSMLASVTTPAATSFFRQWARDNNAQICGLTPGAQSCRP